MRGKAPLPRQGEVELHWGIFEWGDRWFKIKPWYKYIKLRVSQGRKVIRKHDYFTPWGEEVPHTKGSGGQVDGKNLMVLINP